MRTVSRLVRPFILGLVVLLPAAAGAQPPPREVVLTGVALRSDGKTPWRDATVYLRKLTQEDDPAQLVQPFSEGDVGRTAHTDAQGRFSFARVKPGGYCVQVRDAAGVLRNARVSVPEGDPPPPEVKVVMSPLEIRGVVRRYEGGPAMPRAKVDLVRHVRAGRGTLGFGLGSAVSDARGEFRFAHVEEGDYEVSASVAGPAPRLREYNFRRVQVRAGMAPVGVALVLAPYTLTGTVLRADGRPAAGASVVLAPVGDDPPLIPDPPEKAVWARSTRADAKGRFAIPRLSPDVYWVHARLGAEARVTRLGFYDEAPRPVSLRLTRTAIAGKVVQADGTTPIAGTPVQARMAGVVSARAWGPFAAKTNARGEFTLAGCDPGAYVLRAELGGGVVAEAKAEVATEARGSVRLVVPSGEVEGRVVTPAGQPVADANLTLSATAGSYRATTDANGRFRLRRMLPGEHVLQVSQKETRRTLRVEVPAGRPAPPLRVALFSPRLLLRIERPDGTPLRSSVVWEARRTGSGWGQGGGETDGEGRLTVDLDGAPPFSFCYAAPNVGSGTLDVPSIDESGREEERTLRLSAGGTIAGTVREAGTALPAGGVAVMPLLAVKEGATTPLWNAFFSNFHAILLPGHPITAVSRDGDGTYRLQAIPAGAYELSAGGQTRRVTLAEGGALPDVDFTVPAVPGALSIAGRILKPDGVTPLAGTDVTLTLFLVERGHRMPWPKQPGVPRVAHTDDHGAFRLYPVAPEAYWITASAPGIGKSEQATVAVKEKPATGIDFVLEAGQ